MPEGIIPSSFRDPSGFLFRQDGSLYRQVNITYKDNYDHLMNSGLYKSLSDSELLIPHEEVDVTYARPVNAYKVIKPELILFISYPYEWCFSQLKDAALTTLMIQKIALDFGMSLRDGSAYNIQFRKGKPILIDTLSFEKLCEGEPWVAYKQFCQHFLAPLTMMSYTDIRLNQLSRVYLDGVPLDLTSSLLPMSTYFKPFSLFHIHSHAKSQKYYAGRSKTKKQVKRTFSIRSFRGLIDSLESSVKRLTWHPSKTEWTSYYEGNHGDALGILEHKKQLVSEFLDKANPKTVWDLGANTGLFSRIASDRGIQTISFDIDPSCVEKNYLTVVAKRETNLFPLLIDLTNPSPEIGWQNQERMSIFQRGPADTVLALALIHHLAITNNLPLDWIARFFMKICAWLIIEFVPKSDSKVQTLLSTREDIFPDYTRQTFESEFGKFFTIHRSERINNSERTLHLMHRRQ